MINLCNLLFKTMAIMIAGLLIWAMGVTGVQSADSAVFKLGVVNERLNEPDFALAQYSKLQQYLTTHLQKGGIQVASLVIARDVPDMTEKLMTQQVDAVIEGGFPTLTINRRTGQLQPSLLVWRKGQREFHTVFFSRKD